VIKDGICGNSLEISYVIFPITVFDWIHSKIQKHIAEHYHTRSTAFYCEWQSILLKI